jgi:Acyl-CoA carboxylase epsilon subunit
MSAGQVPAARCGGDLDVHVRGGATDEEVAAVVAALQVRQRGEPTTSRFERWRRERLQVLRDNR